MLITTMEGKTLSLPLGTITRARALDGGDWIVTDAQGEDHRVDNAAWKTAVEGTPAAVVPALPGTYLISSSEDTNAEPKVWRNNVIGWMISADTEVRPIVVDMSMIIGGWTVLHADGRVERHTGESWDRLDLWLADASGR